MTEPTELDTARVRSAIEADPTTAVSDLSRQLGVADAAVIRALPERMRREVPQDDWVQTLRAVSDWGKISLRIADSESPIVYVSKDIVLVEPSPGVLRLGDERLSFSCEIREIHSVWLIDKPTPSGTNRGLVVCDDEGQTRWQFLLADGTNPAFDRAWQRLN